VHQHLGKSGRGYAFRTFVAEGQKPVLISTSFTDQNDRLIRQEYANGNVHRYRPHRCSRIVGTCRFTKIEPDGSKRSRVLTGTVSGDTYTYQIEEVTGGLVVRGEIKVDQFGWTREGKVVRPDGKVVRLSQVSSDYK